MLARWPLLPSPAGLAARPAAGRAQTAAPAAPAPPRRRAGDARRRAGRPRPTASPARSCKLQFRGNRKVEDDAIKVNLRTVPGATLTQDLLREDVRAIWKMGFFEDVQVEADQRARAASR